MLIAPNFRGQYYSVIILAIAMVDYQNHIKSSISNHLDQRHLSINLIYPIFLFGSISPVVDLPVFLESQSISLLPLRIWFLILWSTWIKFLGYAKTLDNREGFAFVRDLHFQVLLFECKLTTPLLVMITT